MGLRDVSPTDPSSLLGCDERFLIFYSSRDQDGKLWCPDCRSVEETVGKTFGKDGPAGLIVYVGQKAEWKAASNPFRGEPWRITGVPTIIKLSEDSKEVARLVDDEIIGGLESFVRTVK